MTELTLENNGEIKVTTSKGYSFILREKDGGIIVQGFQGLVACGDVYDNKFFIQELRQIEKEKHPTPNEIRSHIRL